MSVYSEVWDIRSQLSHAQGYIQSSGLRALTRSATEPSAITGGETVEQLEVRARPARCSKMRCKSSMREQSVRTVMSERAGACGKLHALLSLAARAHEDCAHAGMRSLHHGRIKQDDANCQDVRLHRACAHLIELQQQCSAQAEMEQHRHTHDAPGLVSLTVLNSRPPVVKVRSSARSGLPGGSHGTGRASHHCHAGSVIAVLAHDVLPAAVCPASF